MATTNTEHPGFTYSTCEVCGQDVLTFTLTNGVCLKCHEEE